MKKMAKIFLMLVLSFSSVVLWTSCANDKALDIDQFDLEYPAEAPTIDLAQYKTTSEDGDNYTLGYANGNLREQKIDLKWTANTNSNFLCYKVYRGADETNTALTETIEDKTVANYVDLNVGMDTKYFYKVVTVLDNGNSKSDTITVKTPDFSGISETNYDISANGESFTYYFKNNAESATKYLVSIINGGDTTTVEKSINVGDTLVSNTHTVNSGEFYSFNFTAISPYDTLLTAGSIATSMNYDTMNTPGDFDAEQPEEMLNILLTWDDDNHSEDGYLVFRRTSTQSEFTEIAALTKNIEYYTDNSSLLNDTTYFYKVAAYNRAEEDTMYSGTRVVTFDDGSEDNLDFEMGDLTGWSTSDPAWTVVEKEDGYKPETSYWAQSADISDGQSSSISLTKTFEDTKGSEIQFDYELATEYYDHLVFYIDNIEQARWSGYGASTVSFDIEEGTHTFTWTYEKDDIGSSEEDAVWIDNIVLTGEDK